MEEFVLWQAKGMLRNSVCDVQEFCGGFIELDSNGNVWKDKVYAQLVQEYHIQDWSAFELLQSDELCFCGSSKLKPNSRQALQTLSEKGYKLGVVSNGKSPFQERNFKALGVASVFSAVIVSEAVGYRKPQKKIFEQAGKTIAASPSKQFLSGIIHKQIVTVLIRAICIQSSYPVIMAKPMGMLMWSVTIILTW